MSPDSKYKVKVAAVVSGLIPIILAVLAGIKCLVEAL